MVWHDKKKQSNNKVGNRHLTTVMDCRGSTNSENSDNETQPWCLVILYDKTKIFPQYMKKGWCDTKKKTANKLKQRHLDCGGMKSNSDNIQEVSLLAIVEEIDEVFEDWSWGYRQHWNFGYFRSRQTWPWPGPVHDDHPLHLDDRKGRWLRDFDAEDDAGGRRERHLV